MNKKFYITTPIYYPNAELHIGHAYSTILADIFARYHFLNNGDSFLLTGADEHSAKVVKKAESVGEGIEIYLKEITNNFKELFKDLNINYSEFIRTSNKEKHWPGAIQLWKKLKKSGDIYKSTYTGMYCVGCESFLKDKDLINGLCPYHNSAPEKIEEENYFFKLSRYQDQLLEIIEKDKLLILPKERKQEIVSLLRSGLEDISFSRPKDKLQWSIPIPDDETQGIYVWCDALTSYISAIGYGRDEKLFNKYWPADCHLIGKDILKFHAIIWPAMLLSAGMQLPKRILVHGMLLSEGKKMSKTIGNVIAPRKLLSKYGIDTMRYFFATHVSITSDGEINEELFAEKYTSDLVNGLGNLVSRVLGMAILYKIPIKTGPDFKIVVKNNSWYSEKLDQFDLNIVTSEILNKLQNLDKQITKDEPFKIVKSDKKLAEKMITGYLENIWELSQLLRPIMPETSKKIQRAFEDKTKPILFNRIDV